MTPKSAKRLKASGDKKDSFSSPQVHLTSSNDLGMASPNLGLADGNHSESRKKRKKQHASVDTPSAISLPVARDVSERNDKPDSVPDDTTTNGRPCTREGESQGPEDEVLPMNAPSVISNLELVRVLQDSKILRSRKIEEAYKFIKNLENDLQSRDDNERTAFKSQDKVLMAMPQFVSFLSEWVQSAVLWSSKPQQLTKTNDSLQGEEGQRVIPPHLDARYWAILRWCLSSGHLHKFASVSPSLMRPLNLYVNALIEPENSSECELDLSNKFGLSASLTEDSFRSVEVLLLANERSFRPDLDHWVSLASTALSKLVTLNGLASDLDGNMTSLVRQLILCILEGFSRFVAIHPNRRKIFTSFTENLLEYLLVAHATLTNQIPQVSLGESSSSLQRLLQTLEDILEKGLFHAAHVGSFQDVCTVLAGKVDVHIEPGTTEKKRKRNPSRDLNGNVDEGNKDMHLSYHRLLFQKLDNFRRRGIEAALVELGWIFKTYSKSFKSHQVSEEIDVFGFKSKGKPQSLDLTTNDDDNHTGKAEGSGKPVHDAQLGDKKDRNSEALFSVFAEFIGPLTTDLKSFDLSHTSNDVNFSVQHVISAKALLGAVAGLLKAAKTENTYVPTEDSDSQAHFSFLDSCFNTVVGVGKSLPSLFASLGAKAQKGDKIAQVRSSSDNMDQQKLKIVFADILLEMIIAINYLIELDYRVVENSLRDVWIILLAGVALQQTSRGDDLSFKDVSTSIRQEAIEVACHIINIFSDLRQVDQALFSFCVTLRRFMSQGSVVCHLGKQSTPSSMATDTVAEEVSLLTFLNLEAAELLACAKPLLLAISLAMQALPEGQVAEFLRLLTVDALESIPLVSFSENLEQKFRVGNGESGKKRVTVGLKALVELYCCMLENVNIVGTNSIQAGKVIRQFLMQIVTPKLVHLIDFFTLSKTSEDDTTLVLQTKEKIDAIVDSPRKCDSAAYSGKTLQDDILLKSWSLVFFLRLYITTQSLHRECISLMPPKAAKKAREALDGPALDNLKGDITDILTRYGAASFLSGVGRGAVKVSHFLAGIEGKQDSEELVNCPSLSYLLECIALQSLAQLSRHIEAVSFLVTRFKLANVVSNESIKTKEPGLQSIEVDNEDLSAAKVHLGVQKKLQKLLKDLKKESQKLAKFLLREVGWQEDNRDAKLTSEISNCLSQGERNTFPSERVSKVALLADFSSQQSPKQNWDSVESTLTVDTLPIQRWNLVCKSFDIWAKFAAEEELRKFVVFLFSSSLAVPSTITASEEQNKMPKTISQEHYRKQITDDLLCNALFYEEESFRRVLPSTFVEELKKSSLSAFGTWPFESHALNSFLAAEVLSHTGQDWSDFTIEIEAVIGARGQEQASNSASMMKRRETYGFSNQASEKRDNQLQDTTPVKGDQLTSASSASKRQRPDSVNGKAPSKQSKKRWSDSHLNALDHCVRLVRHLSALPLGYIEPNECATCAFTLLCFERLLTSSLLELRATALGSSRASATVQNVEFPTVVKLLQALSACRSALLALISSDTLSVSNSMLMAFLAGFSRWLPLSIQAATISLVDSLECSNLPAQERRHMVSLGKTLLYELLKSTARIVTVLTEETLSIEERKDSIQDNGPMTITTKVVGANAECNPTITDSKAGGHSLVELIDYQVERIDQLITSSFDEEVDFSQHQEDGCHDTSGMKAYFEGLTLSSSLSSYFWSLRKCSEKLSIDQNRPLALPTPSLCHAQKVGLVLTGALLRALVPADSHAVLLLGEHEVDRTYDSGEKKFKITIVNQSRQEDNLVATIGDEDDGEEDNEESDLPTVVPAAEESGDEEDEQKDTEDLDLDGQNDYSLHLETHGGIRKGEFGKHGSETEATELLYTAKSHLQRSLLENLLRSSCSNKCEIIGELYLATAGILKLESINLSDSKLALVSASSSGKGSQFQEGLPSAVNLLMGAGYWLLMKAAEDSQPGHWSHLGWLIGVVKYLESVYCLTPYIKPLLPPLAFSKLFNMHIHLLGSLTPSEEQFHSLKLPHPLDVEDQQGISNDQVTEGDGSHNKDAKASSPHSLRTAVRESLGTLLRTASRYHSVLALQSIMRALVGVSDSNHSSGLEIGRFEDGKVGRGVAAGIECLSIALETVSGTKRLRLLANHFHEFFGAIFNIMEYLQGPNLFLVSEPPFSQGDSIEAETRSTLAGSKVHSGPVILQALQILVTTASRDTIFPMKACHVALALHCPARLFWPVYRSGLSKQEFILKQHSAAERPGLGQLKDVHVTGVVRIGTELGVKLYVSCCRLLCSIIRHHRRESGHCIALLGDSARVLLHCLEAPNWPSSDEDGTKKWSIKMSAYCASWLRRIYEEMGEHKETLGKYCSHFLSDYLSVISGHGPRAAGLIREVEAALQPGAYVLVDACSANDLQQLHASLGEGPRRNALLNLRRQYQQQFQYKGKV